jgi:c-di-GMP-binding flagellar brake protein YcgR
MGLFKRREPERGAERRRYPRVTNSLRVNYQIANEILHSDCRTQDISEGGIRLSLYQKLATGTTLKLYIYLQDIAEPVLVLGRVAWIRETPGREYPHDAGIEFDFIDPALRVKIRDYIQTISPKK